MPSLSREAIKAAAAKIQRRTSTVDVPQLGGTVTLAEPTAAALDAYELASDARRKAGTSPCVRARLVILCAVDEHGEQLFTEDDAAWLDKLPATAIDPIVTPCLDLTGYTHDDLETLAKN